MWLPDTSIYDEKIIVIEIAGSNELFIIVVAAQWF